MSIYHKNNKKAKKKNILIKKNIKNLNLKKKQSIFLKIILLIYILKKNILLDIQQKTYLFRESFQLSFQKVKINNEKYF